MLLGRRPYFLELVKTPEGYGKRDRKLMRVSCRWCDPRGVFRCTKREQESSYKILSGVTSLGFGTRENQP